MNPTTLCEPRPMSFSPLPGPFLHEAGAVASRDHTAIELGAGDGALTGVLAGLGLRVTALDRRRPLPPGGPGLVGDALAPPLATGCCDLVVAANLLRHLAPRRPRLDFLADWVALLKPGGGLYLLEDAPRPATGPAGNYGRLQVLLAQLAPEARGPLLPAAGVWERIGRLGLKAQGGTWENRWALDRDRVLELLAGGRPAPGSEVAALIAAIADEGIACGPAWWLRVAREDS